MSTKIRVLIVVLATAALTAVIAISFLSDKGNETIFQPENPERFIGNTESELVLTLGEPNTRDTYAMDQAYGEFRVSLFNTYPPDLPNLSEIQIREYTWEYDHNKFTAWLHAVDDEWQILDTCQYETEAVF